MVTDKVTYPTVRFSHMSTCSSTRVYRQEKHGKVIYIQAKCVTYHRKRVHSQGRDPICRRSTAGDTLYSWLESMKVLESHSNKPSLFQGLQRSPKVPCFPCFPNMFQNHGMWPRKLIKHVSNRSNRSGMEPPWPAKSSPGCAVRGSFKFWLFGLKRTSLLQIVSIQVRVALEQNHIGTTVM